MFMPLHNTLCDNVSLYLSIPPSVVLDLYTLQLQVLLLCQGKKESSEVLTLNCQTVEMYVHLCKIKMPPARGIVLRKFARFKASLSIHSDAAQYMEYTKNAPSKLQFVPTLL